MQARRPSHGRRAGLPRATWGGWRAKCRGDRERTRRGSGREQTGPRLGSVAPSSFRGTTPGMNGINLLFVALAAFVLVVLVFYVAGHA